MNTLHNNAWEEFKMEFWDRIQKDIGKNLKEGLKTIKEKADELTGEGKRKYMAYDIKSQIHKSMADLGAEVYSLKKTNENPLKTPKVESLIGKIAKLEKKLAEIEPSKATPKPTAKKAAKKTTKKKAAKKAVKKKSP